MTPRQSTRRRTPQEAQRQEQKQEHQQQYQIQSEPGQEREQITLSVDQTLEPRAARAAKVVDLLRVNEVSAVKKTFCTSTVILVLCVDLPKYFGSSTMIFEYKHLIMLFMLRCVYLLIFETQRAAYTFYDELGFGVTKRIRAAKPKIENQQREQSQANNKQPEEQQLQQQKQTIAPIQPQTRSSQRISQQHETGISPPSSNPAVPNFVRQRVDTEITKRTQPPPLPPLSSSLSFSNNPIISNETLYIDTTVPVETAETPMIKKNRVMRNEFPISYQPDFATPYIHDTKSSDPPVPIPNFPEMKRRRSSIGMRGKRLSNSPSGLATALPHKTLDPAEYYRHVDAEQSDPVRLRQILVWCAKRIKAECEGEECDANVLKMYDAVIQGLVSKKISTSWYNRDRASDDISRTFEKKNVKPNPDNAINLTKKKELETEIHALIKEEEEWNAILTSHNVAKTQKQFGVAGMVAEKQPNKLDAVSVLSEQEWSVLALIDKQQGQDSVTQTGKEKVSVGEWAESLVKAVQFDVHSRRDALGTLARKAKFSQRDCDTLFSSLIGAYESDRLKRQEILEPMDVLKMLGGIGTGTDERSDQN
ncbi:hypothetical protein HK100_010935 [Physocladia obscura]|uniref:Kinetochore protein mis13 n=1 Tax=Physocladia obscura TaxID=109957 RepID=A0AAD5T2V7_9FUNG|nr:hypothetical protein HK100_010935 [Physocladia obscura]